LISSAVRVATLGDSPYLPLLAVVRTTLGLDSTISIGVQTDYLSWTKQVCMANIDKQHYPVNNLSRTK
jgi:hypothetical protein